MASSALRDWRGDRAARLDELFDAHRRVGGTAAGRRTTTEQINWALVLRFAAEFQGFSRDLHTLGVETFAAEAAGANSSLRHVITTLLTQGLKLDTGNAEPGALGDAFNRFGLSWWPALKQREDRTEGRQLQLARLNRARNAIAHARLDELSALRSEGFPLTLDTVRTWRGSLNGLAVTMDGVLASHLALFFDRPSPW
jgi:hypothetical protein